MTDLTQRDIADLLGLTTRQIRNLENEGMPHRAEKNRKFYPMPDAARWYYEREVARSRQEPSDYGDARAREMAARAEKAEIEVLQLRAEVIHVSDLEAMHARPLAQLRARLLALPGRLAAELPLPAVESVEIMEPIVHEMMHELSESDDDEPGDA
jgi:phage terminase Nu1 subunit (DNA packaging protein)